MADSAHRARQRRILVWCLCAVVVSIVWRIGPSLPVGVVDRVTPPFTLTWMEQTETLSAADSGVRIECAPALRRVGLHSGAQVIPPPGSATAPILWSHPMHVIRWLCPHHTDPRAADPPLKM